MRPERRGGPESRSWYGIRGGSGHQALLSRGGLIPSSITYNLSDQKTQTTFLDGAIRDYRYNPDGTIDEFDETIGATTTTYELSYNGGGQLTAVSIQP